MKIFGKLMSAFVVILLISFIYFFNQEQWVASGFIFLALVLGLIGLTHINIKSKQ